MNLADVDQGLNPCGANSQNDVQVGSEIYGMAREKAALKRPHSKRFARFQSRMAGAERLECARFTAAFGCNQRSRFRGGCRLQTIFALKRLQTMGHPSPGNKKSPHGWRALIAGF
jgi:hypothetical protein